MPRKNMLTMETNSSAARIGFFTSKWQSPGNNQPASNTSVGDTALCRTGPLVVWVTAIRCRSYQLDSNQFPLNLPGNNGTPRLRDHVDLAPHPKALRTGR